jgi:hypothetical protein
VYALAGLVNAQLDLLLRYLAKIATFAYYRLAIYLLLILLYYLNTLQYLIIVGCV